MTPTPSPLTPEEIDRIERAGFGTSGTGQLLARAIATIRQLEGQVKEAMTVIEHGRELKDYAKSVVLKRGNEYALQNLANALNRFDAADQHATLNRLEGGKE